MGIVLRFVAGNGLKGLLEDGPEVQAKGVVERRRAVLDPFGDTHCGFEVCGRRGGEELVIK